MYRQTWIIQLLRARMFRESVRSTHKWRTS